MFERFLKEAREVAARSQDEARACGAPRIEAEHVLLALAAQGQPGLDHAELREALEHETERSLAAIGVSLDSFALPPAQSPPGKIPFGTSAKHALERSFEVAVARGDKRIGPGHILLALLRLREGTVPRALGHAGVDRDALAARTEAALAG